MFICLHFSNSPLIQAHKTYAKGVFDMLFINSTKYLFSERVSFYCHIGPTPL